MIALMQMYRQHNHQRGQALAEMLVITAGFLAFVFAFTPILAKVMDARHKIQTAARYGAWERTIYYDKPEWHYRTAALKPAATLADEIGARTVAHGRARIGAAFSANAADLDPLLMYNNRLTGAREIFIRNQRPTGPTLPRYVANRDLNSTTPGLANQLTLFSRANTPAANMPDLPEKGLYKSYAHINLKEQPWWPEFATGDIAAHSTNVILADGWNAESGWATKEEIKEGKATKFINREFNPVAREFGRWLNVGCIAVDIKCGNDMLLLRDISGNTESVPAQQLARYNGN